MLFLAVSVHLGPFCLAHIFLYIYIHGIVLMDFNICYEALPWIFYNSRDPVIYFYAFFFFFIVAQYSLCNVVFVQYTFGCMVYD